MIAVGIDVSKSKSTVAIPSRKARVICMVSLLSRLGLPFNTSIFMISPSFA